MKRRTYLDGLKEAAYIAGYIGKPILPAVRKSTKAFNARAAGAKDVHGVLRVLIKRESMRLARLKK